MAIWREPLSVLAATALSGSCSSLGGLFLLLFLRPKILKADFLKERPSSWSGIDIQLSGGGSYVREAN